MHPVVLSREPFVSLNLNPGALAPAVSHGETGGALQPLGPSIQELPALLT